MKKENSRTIAFAWALLGLGCAGAPAGDPPPAPAQARTQPKLTESAPPPASSPPLPPAPASPPKGAPEPAPPKLDALEVTFQDYRRCVDARQCTTPAGGWRGTPYLPATGVTLEQAVVYCAFARTRLPTDREWTLAIEAAGAPFPWGNDRFGGRSNCAHSEAGYQLIPPGRMKDDVVNGVYDLHGNATEWTSDRTVRGSRGCSQPLGTSETPPATHGAYVGFRCMAKQSP